MNRQTKDEFRAIITSEEETAAFGQALAKLLRAGDVVCLRGDLGAGKTTLTRALVAGMGSPAPVSSPTFTLVHEYRGGSLPIWHVDAYRLTGAQDTVDIGLEEVLLTGEGIVVIEWPERIEASLPDDRLDVSIRDTGGDTREIILTPKGPRWVEFSNQWAEQWQ
ncbi:MAG: tRNA (adenosine(37)-N6)-threonylcarbamoyltransferase complex ATPase subunit type 1 TsaE [Armatimonadota bacterium]